MLVINSIEKTRLSADSYSYSGTGVAWKARLVLFLGFALMAGGLAGSVVSGIFRSGFGGRIWDGCWEKITESGDVEKSWDAEHEGDGLIMCRRLFWY